MLKIVQVTHAKFPPAIRVLKNGTSYTNLGYQSIVISPRYADQKSFEVISGIEVYRPCIFEKRGNVSLFMERAFFRSSLWTMNLERLFKQIEPDVIHCHDIWLSRICFDSMRGCKFILDLHENMPAAVVEYLKSYSGLDYLFRIIFHREKRIRNLERYALSKSDAVLVVVEEAKIRVLREHKFIKKDLVYVVENFERKNFSERSFTKAKDYKNAKFTFLYIGGFGPHRGLEILILAAKEMLKIRHVDIVVRLVGAVPSTYLDSLYRLILVNDCGSFVDIIGWVSSERVGEFISDSDVCCIPHLSNPHTDNTIPHKIYQYMSLSKPILVSSSAPLARVIIKSQAGVVFDAGDIMSCAKEMIYLMDKSSNLSEMGSNGYCYVTESGNNWEESSEIILSKVIKNL